MGPKVSALNTQIQKYFSLDFDNSECGQKGLCCINLCIRFHDIGFVWISVWFSCWYNWNSFIVCQRNTTDEVLMDTSVTTMIAFGFECNESAWLAHDMYRFLKCYRDDYRWCYEPDLDIATEGLLSAVGAFLFLGKSNKKLAFPI